MFSAHSGLLKDPLPGPLLHTASHHLLQHKGVCSGMGETPDLRAALPRLAQDTLAFQPQLHW